MKKAIFLIGLLLLVMLLAKPAIANAHDPDMQAMETANYQTYFSPSVTSEQGTTLQNGSRSWFSMITNIGQTPVTNATVSVMSGYDPSLFEGVTAFPFVNSFASLAPGQNQFAGRLFTTGNPILVNYTSGYDSTKTVTPITIPVGGTHQTVTITLKLVDSSRWVPTAGGQFMFWIYSRVPGVTGVSMTNPTNLDPGENIQSQEVSDDQNNLVVWDLVGNLKHNKQYTFIAVLNVPNPYGVPYEFQPEVRIDGNISKAPPVCDSCAGPSVTITDPTLDGNLTGQGAVTFSIAETDRIWYARHDDVYSTIYGGTEQPDFNPPTSKDQCKKGVWQTFTFPSFKNQGDCVSYVATHGKNPPNGN